MLNDQNSQFQRITKLDENQTIKTNVQVRPRASNYQTVHSNFEPSFYAREALAKELKEDWK